MGYRGKLDDQARARELRAASWTLQAIADELGVAKSSVSRWVRDVEFVPRPRNRGNSVTRPHPLHVRKLAEIDECRAWARRALGELSDRDLFLAGIGLYAGDGAKTGTEVRFANSNPDLVGVFMQWLRTFFEIDESRLRVHLYLHAGLDLDAAVDSWARVTGVPPRQFNKPYRAVADAGIRHNKHQYGCAHVRYSSVKLLRQVLGLIEALVS